ncbi:MAG: hypothetical protein OQK97_12775 [Deltaproteobacteria bacterium]|nr:hypothetical protein [Deltaproteobacteria bacterium]
MSKSIKLLLYVILLLLLIVGQAQSFSNLVASSAAKGTVVETMNAGGYTYLCVEGNGQKTWAAVRETPVKVGEEVEVVEGAVMQNFTSKSLGRTFDSIIFSNGVVKL